jgi:hypothetical protein
MSNWANEKDELLQHLQASNQKSAKVAETEAECCSQGEEIKNLQKNNYGLAG